MYSRFEDDYVLLEKCRTHLNNPQTHQTQLLISAGICVKEGFMLTGTTPTDIRQQLIGFEYLMIGLELYLASYKKLGLRLCKECFDSISHKLLPMLDESDKRRAKVEQLVAEYTQINHD